jgi:TorA maturation chaperone TorD
MLHISQRQRLYAFFSQLFTYPDAELLTVLQGESPAEVGVLLGVAPPASAGLSLVALQEAYTGLFISRHGGVPAPPYGSVYLDDGVLMGASTLKVTEAYHAAGLVIDGSSEPADFLATELEFLYFLVGREEEGFRGRDVAAARLATSRQHDFLVNSLLPWLEPFADRIASSDAPPIYRWAAAGLLAFCRDEQSWLARLN